MYIVAVLRDHAP